MRALIAEDDFTSRLLLQKLLSPFGEVHVAINGREALEAYAAAKRKRRPYDLICLDIMMPEMDGQTVLREIRTQEEGERTLTRRRVKILMTTALQDWANISTAFKELCDGYLTKPIDKAKLLRRLAEMGFAAA
jgi:two-component system chemotaxis response regulator CheY